MLACGVPRLGTFKHRHFNPLIRTRHRASNRRSDAKDDSRCRPNGGPSVEICGIARPIWDCSGSVGSAWPCSAREGTATTWLDRYQ